LPLTKRLGHKTFLGWVLLKVINIKAMDDCLDKVAAKELTFSHPTNQAWIQSLKALGDLDYYGHFPRPFYRLTAKGEYIIKGVEGNDKCQVVFLDYTKETESTLISTLDRLGDVTP
jgi:hypothetical protein